MFKHNNNLKQTNNEATIIINKAYLATHLNPTERFSAPVALAWPSASPDAAVPRLPLLLGVVGLGGGHIWVVVHVVPYDEATWKLTWTG